jgi:hypothetical protein
VNLKIIGEGVSIYNKNSFEKTGSETLYATKAQDLQKAIYDDVRDNYNNKW